MNDEQVMSVGSYHDNCLTETLHGHIDDAVELKRLNDYRPELNWSQDQLNVVLRSAIALRNGWHVWNVSGPQWRVEIVANEVMCNGPHEVKWMWEADRCSVVLVSEHPMTLDRETVCKVEVL